MVKSKEPISRHKPESAVMAEQVEIETIEEWLRNVDKPLTPEKKNGKNEAISMCGISRTMVAVRD